MDPTERVPLSSRGLSVTRLGLGCAPLAGLFSAVSPEQAHATLERAWQLGIRFFDTAPLYGLGESERRLGRFLSTKRGEAVVATKVGRLLRSRPPSAADLDRSALASFPHATDRVPVWDFTYAGVRSSLEESLERAGVDRFQMVHLHDPDGRGREALDSAWSALCDMRDEGTIDAVSVGANDAGVLAAFARERDPDCLMVAGRYTLLDRTAARELLPACERRGIPVIAAGVFNSGVLARPLPGAMFDYAPATAGILERARALERACSRRRVPLPAAALQFPLLHPAVRCVIVGARSPQELSDAVEWSRLPIPDSLWAELDARVLIKPTEN